MIPSTVYEIESINQFHLSNEDFAKLIGAYKLNFTKQLEFNNKFEIEADKPQDDSTQKLKDFLQEKLNKAFKDQEKLSSYKEKIGEEITSTDRGIHDGFHVANVALYAKKFLKIYQQNKELFSPEIQEEIAEFDDPKKVRDLEILCLMHDVARVNKQPDQNEYKNAFYVALMLREMGDERFQGDEISEEGLKMIMDLASKESKTKDKSLMSKLIQSSDSLAILRDPHFRDGSTAYNFDLNDVFKDFSEIDYAHAPIRDKLQKSIRESVSKISLIEKNPNILLDNLECQKDPQQVFLEHKKTILLMDAFDEGLEMLKTDDTVEAFPGRKLRDMFYVHVMGVHSPYPLDKQGQKFICATILSSSGVIRSYADRSWRNNPVLILGREDESGVVFSSGFKTDVGSSALFKSGRTFASNIEASHWVQMMQREGLHASYFDKMIYTQERMAEKLQEMITRRNHPELDISDGEYLLLDEVGTTKTGKVGKDRYQEGYSAPHHEVRTNSGELRHNEIHILNSVHIVDFVGIARDVFEHTPAHKVGQFSDFSHFGLLRLKFYKDQINFEKKRLLSLDKPMEDEKFKNCVEFELSRVTNVFEKIGQLKKLTQELRDNPNHPLIKKSVQKKISKEPEFKGSKFQDSAENSKIIQERKIEKFYNELEGLYKKLEEFEKPESFGFTDLKAKADELCQKDNIFEEIKEWKNGIMSGESNQTQLNIAISRVKSGLQKETQMALYDVVKSQEIKILSDEEYQKKFVKTPELFRELCERKDYSSILLLYTKKEINQLSQDEAGSQLKDGSALPNYQTIFSETFKKITSSQLGLLIKMGLDIYSLPDKSDDKEYQEYCGISCLSSSYEHNKMIYCIAPYKFPESFLYSRYKSKDYEITQKLIKFGVLFSEDMPPSSFHEEEVVFFYLNKYLNSGMIANFKDNLLTALKKYNSEDDLAKIESTLKFTRLPHDARERQTTLNGYGLLRMFDRYQTQILTKDDKEMSALVNKLKILRGDKEPDRAVSSAQQSSLVFVTSPPSRNSMEAT
jgi:hypothetical protein